MKLTEYQKYFLERAKKGYAVSANRRHFKAQQWREVQELVQAGLLRKSDPTAWNRAGAFMSVSV
jgi:hypothetical protein